MKKAGMMKRKLLKALKIAVGSSVAICIANMLHLEYEISAGTIALLTVVTTKWETLRLSLYRMITLALTIGLAGILFLNVNNEWIAYGCFVFLLIIMSEMFGWGSTISVNAVIGAHFLTTMDFSPNFIWNEIMLVVIGITIAIILNLFHANGMAKNELIISMSETEGELQLVLEEIADYLSNKAMQRDVWTDVRQLESRVKQYVMDACEYQDNTFSSHPGYYIDYFEMRLQQCNILHNLHYEVKKMREMPAQAKIVADYILYMMDYVVEKNIPESQLEKLQELFENMKKEPLPESRAEFENRAILYHVLMDLEDFLICKKRFVEGLDEKQKKIYWNF